MGQDPCQPLAPPAKAVCEGRRGCCSAGGSLLLTPLSPDQGASALHELLGEEKPGQKAPYGGHGGHGTLHLALPFCPSQGMSPLATAPFSPPQRRLQSRALVELAGLWGQGSRAGLWGQGRRAGLLWGLAEPARMAWAPGWGPSFPLQHSSAGQQQAPSCPNQGMRNTGGFGLAF